MSISLYTNTRPKVLHFLLLFISTALFPLSATLRAPAHFMASKCISNLKELSSKAFEIHTDFLLSSFKAFTRQYIRLFHATKGKPYLLRFIGYRSMGITFFNNSTSMSLIKHKQLAIYREVTSKFEFLLVKRNCVINNLVSRTEDQINVI